MNNNMVNAQKYTRRAFVIKDSDPPTRVFVEWDGSGSTQRFVAGVEIQAGNGTWLESPGKQVVQGEQQMWEMAEMLWTKAGGA